MGQIQSVARVVENGGGMSLRDYFAGQAMEGEIASSSTHEVAFAVAKAAVESNRSVEQQIAFNAYKMADAMLQARDSQLL